MDAWLLDGKLAPPERPTPWLARPIAPQNLPPLTWLVGGPGTGKTLGLVALAERFAAPAASVWLGLDAQDADPATFFHYLVAGMRRHVPDFGAEVLSLAAGAGGDVRPVWQRFFKSVEAYNPPALLLAFDDYAPDVKDHPLAALSYFADKLPRGVRVAIASRQRPPSSLARARAAGKLALVDADALAFTPDEVESYLAARAEGEVPDAWRQAAAELDGWPLGVSLVALEVAPAPSIRASVADFVMDAIVDGQPDAMRTFLRQAATLPEITADACRWSFQALDAADRLAELEAVQLVQRSGDGTTYRFPRYLRDALLAEAERTVPDIERAGWHRRAAGYYRDRGRDELALGHWIAAREWDEAVAAAEIAFAAMRLDGRQPQIAKTLQGLPPGVLAQEPTLLVWQGHTLAWSGQRDEAGQRYDAAAKLYREREDGRGEFRVLVRQATLAMRRGDYPRFNQLTLQAMARAGEGRANDVVDLHLARAAVADFRGDGQLMRECNESALTVPVAGDGDLASSHVIAHLNLYTADVHAGDLAGARRHGEAALAIAEEHAFLSYKLYAGFLLAHLDALVGDAESAGARLKAMPPDWEGLLNWHMRAIGQLVVGLWHAGRGEHKEADQAIAKSRATFQAAGYAEGLKVPLEAQLWLLIQRKQPEQAIALGEAEGEVRNFYDAAVAVPYALALLQAGRAKEAHERLSALVTTCDELGAKLLAARARRHQAEAEAALGLPGAKATRADAASRIQGGGWDFLKLEAEPVEAPMEKAAPVEAGGRLALQCFGNFQIRVDGQPIDQWPRRKAKLLLAALALHPRGVDSLTLAEWLGDGDATSGAEILKTNVKALRSALEPGRARGQASSFVIGEGDRFRLAPEQLASCDLAAFDEDLTAARELEASDPMAAAARYERGVAWYRGPLLDETLLRDHFAAERARYQERTSDACAWLARFHMGRGDRTRAEAMWREAVAVAPTHEAGYLALMRFLHEAGKADRARQVYWDCRYALKQHLDAAPSEAFEAAAKAF